jgi:DNA-binding NtrC family response regulator
MTMPKANAAIDHSDVLVGMTPIVTTLLVVDDDPIQRRVISKLGVQAGHRTMMASSLETAIVTLESEHVDLISIDIGLGANSGLDLLQFVASMNRGIKVLIISGASEFLLESTRNFAHQKRVPLFGVFAKPLDLAGLRQAMTKAREACWLEKQEEERGSCDVF